MELIDATRPTLLGFSGGPDSSALLQWALDHKIPSLHLVHIDHGWRSTSAKEAEQLKELARLHALPFHLKRLDHMPSSNLEEHGRLERLKFFKEIYKAVGAGTLLLGHHRDDLIETVLKRLFEGASLSKLKGMARTQVIDGMRVVRPLLDQPKDALISPFIPIIDPSNDDPRFLRARLRNQIIPLLESHFGKSIQSNLARLSHRASELDAYMKRRTAHITIQKGPFGALIDADLSQIDPFEWRYLASQLTSLTASQLDTVERLQKGRGQIPLIKGTLYIDRGRLILFKHEKITTRLGPLTQTNWQEIVLSRPCLSAPHPITQLTTLPKDLAERYRKAKVPAFLRKLLPVVQEENQFLLFTNGSQVEKKGVAFYV